MKIVHSFILSAVCESEETSLQQWKKQWKKENLSKKTKKQTNKQTSKHIKLDKT